MPEMAVPMARPNLGPDHPMSRVRLLDYITVLNGLSKTRPAALGIEFIEGSKQRLSGNHIHVKPGLFVIPEVVLKRPLRPVLLRHSILLRRKPRDRFGI